MNAFIRGLTAALSIAFAFAFAFTDATELSARE